MRLLRVVVVLALLAAAGLSAYACFGDMAPQRREMRVPVSLTGEPLPEAAPEAPPAEAAADGATAAEGSGAAASTQAPAAGADVLD